MPPTSEVLNPASQPATFPLRSVAGALGIFALFVAPAVLLEGWHRDLQRRCRSISDELLTLDKKWVVVSEHLQEAETARGQIKAASAHLDLVSREWSAPKWAAQAVQSLTTAIDPHIELEAIYARSASENSPGPELGISGFATGAEPRLTLDGVRRAVDRDLEWRFGKGVVETYFEKLEEVAKTEAPAESTEETRVAFTIVARVHRQEPAAAADTHP